MYIHRWIPRSVSPDGQTAWRQGGPGPWDAFQGRSFYRGGGWGPSWSVLVASCGEVGKYKQKLIKNGSRNGMHFGIDSERFCEPTWGGWSIKSWNVSIPKRIFFFDGFMVGDFSAKTRPTCLAHGSRGSARRNAQVPGEDYGKVHEAKRVSMGIYK